jgi:alpha-2-macroglobulin-like protein
VREITIQKMILPVVDIKLVFERESYGVGETALATASIRNFENQPLSNTDITVQFVANYSNGENKYTTERMRTDEEGQVKIKYKIKHNLRTEDVRLTVFCEYKRMEESKSIAVPIVLYPEGIDMQFFPEGGEYLVAGENNHVGFKGLGEYGGALDVAGDIIDSLGVVQTTFSSYYKGMGQLQFVPKIGMKYFARLSQPAGAKFNYLLPEVKADIYAIQLAEQNQYELKINAYSPKADTIFLVAHQNGQMVYSEAMSAKMGMNAFVIDSKDWGIGLATLTLFDAGKIPQVERLVFCNQHKKLNVSLKTNKEKFGVREKVTVQLAVKDHNGKPVMGDFSLSVADDKQLSFHDDQQAHILASLLLEQQEIKGKVDAPNFYFDDESKTDRKLPNINRKKALDNLLMTQGWRALNWKAVREDVFSPINYSNKMVKMPNIRGRVQDKLGYSNIKDELVLLKCADPTVPICSVRTNIYGEYEFKNIDWRKAYTLQISNKPYYAPFVKAVSDTAYIITKLDLQQPTAEECNMSPAMCSLYEVLKAQEQARKAQEEARKAQEEAIVARIMAERTSAYSRNINSLGSGRTGVTQRDLGENVSSSGSRSSSGDVYIDGVRTGSAAYPDGGKPSAPPPPPATKKPLEPKAADFSAAKTAMAAEKAAFANAQADKPRHIAWLDVPRDFYTPRYASAAEDSDIIRNDFRKTIYWQPTVRTDKDGLAQIEFYQSDDISQFRITVEGIDQQGSIGRAEHKYFALMPISIQAKLPTEVIVGDTIQLLVTISNNTDSLMFGHIDLDLPQHLRLVWADTTVKKLSSIPAKGNIILKMALEVLPEPNSDDLIIAYTSSMNVKDRMVCNIRSRLRGFPVHQTYAVDTAYKKIEFDFTNINAGSASGEIVLLPNSIDEILATAKAMGRMPSGCFEQVSSSNYPNVLALQLLNLSPQKDVTTINNLQGYIKTGYEKLAAYECPNGGFDWYGKSPANEALTAFGLMQFAEMQNVHDVNKEMMQRTYKWLLAKRDGKGGWENASTHRYSWGKDKKDLLNTYIVWAMSEAGYGKELQKEINQAYTYALQTEDPYLMALVANTLLGNKDSRAAELLQKLLAKQQEDGFFSGNKCGMTGSTGISLKVETTALVALALQKANNQPQKLNQLVKLLKQSNSTYGFGSTQANVLVLKVFKHYAKTNNYETDTDFIVELNGKIISQQIINANTPNLTIPLPAFANQQHQLVIRQKSKGASIPYLLKLNYYTKQPLTQPECALRFTSQFAAPTVALNNEIRLTTTIENVSKITQAMAIIQIGIPAGLSLSLPQLLQLQKETKFDYYEFFDGMLVLHFRQLKAKEKRKINLDLKADIAGSYEAPATSAYLYYTNEFKFWQQPNRITVVSSK